MPNKSYMVYLQSIRIVLKKLLDKSTGNDAIASET
jgi:hypothetical protein